MPFNPRTWLLWSLIVVFLPCCVQAQTEIRQQSDSILEAYCKTVRTRVQSEEVLPMCDTLYARAVESENRQMQVMALCLRADHFYSCCDTSVPLVEAVDRVKQFCIRNGKSEFIRFYYYVWSSRLIAYYISHNQSNAAVYETCSMLDEARKDNYPQAIAESFTILADLYFSQSDFRQAYQNYAAAISVREQHDVDDVPLAIPYAAQAECALELNMPDSAVLLIQRGRQHSLNVPYSRYIMDRVEILYLLQTGRLEKAYRRLKQLEALFQQEKGMAPYLADLHALQARYYEATGEYGPARKVAAGILGDTTFRISEKLRMQVVKQLGDLSWRLRDEAASAAYYRDYIARTDSVRMQEARRAINDLSTILQVGQLQNEARAMQLDLQHKRLRNTYMAIALLILFMILGAMNHFRKIKFIRRLKASEMTVLSQNEHLRAAGEELRLAKERAERADRMKTDFIQHMSHEVRTPLNSIVGFSQVLAAQFRHMPSTEEYASIIEYNSMNLLRLVDDVLDVAFLDGIDELPRPDIMWLNDECRECVDKALPGLKQGVAMFFEPSVDDPQVRINARRVKQVLSQLLHNAAKFTSEGAVILEYNCLVHKRLLHFVVSDTGPGLPEEAREKVFERFMKLDTFVQGSGLGLPISRTIATKLGGRIYVDSAYTLGCRIVFEVPYDNFSDGIA